MSNHIGFGPMTDLDTPDKRASVGNADPRLTRTNYFDGRLLTARDLIRDQHYLDDRLREVGRAIGSGIAHGLQVSLSDRGLLTVRPGLAVSPSGRVLELAERPLHINLYDQALLSELNGGLSQVLDNGLYAVALQFLEIGTDGAEVYPQDLASERTFHYNTYSEGVEVVLVPLRTPLPQTNKVLGQQRLAGHRGLGARAALVPELIQRDGQPPELPGDAVALALLAIGNQRPLWLDAGLVRRPLRAADHPQALQQDLFTHYLELYGEVTTVRSGLGLRQDYPADLYFRQLPPHGPVPKEGLTPADGVQTFFPAHITVNVAPVREGDLPALIAESAALDPIDLERDEQAEVMVVVPMGDTDFAWRARQLQHVSGDDDTLKHTRLAHLDPLALRLREQPLPVHVVDTDASVWADIWSAIDTVYYLRRPPRVAETQVSAVVLASGYTVPPAGSRPPPDSARLEQQLAEARESLTTCQAELEKARKALEESTGADADVLAACREQLRTTEQRLVDARTQAAEAAAEGQQALADAAELEKQLKQAQDTIAELQAKLESGGAADPALQAQLEDCQKQVAVLNDQLAKLKAQADLAGSLQAERDKLEQELAAAQALIKELQTGIDTGGQISLLEARIKQLTAERDSALARLAACEAARGGRLDLAKVATVRQVSDPGALAAIDVLDKAAQQDSKTADAIADALLLVDRRYDSVLFESLVVMGKAGTLPQFIELLGKRDPRVPLGGAVSENAARLKLTEPLATGWLKLDA